MDDRSRLRAFSCRPLLLALSLVPGASLLAGALAVAPSDARPVVDITVPHVQRPPLVDGRGLDEAWRAQPWTPLADSRLAPGEHLAVKGCTDGVKLFLLVRFPAAVERRRHRPWRWDPVAQQYLAGAEEEQALTVLWFGDAERDDAWMWRSDRTDAAGYADDGTFSPADGMRSDGGTPCWESRYVANFAGEELPRFYPREPTGSLADVRACGVWEEGFWTVELSRPLDTGWSDDVPLRSGVPCEGQVFTGLPDDVPMTGWPRLRFRLSPAVVGKEER